MDGWCRLASPSKARARHDGATIQRRQHRSPDRGAHPDAIHQCGTPSRQGQVVEKRQPAHVHYWCSHSLPVHCPHCRRRQAAVAFIKKRTRAFVSFWLEFFNFQVFIDMSKNLTGEKATIFFSGAFSAFTFFYFDGMTTFISSSGANFWGNSF